MAGKDGARSSPGGPGGYRAAKRLFALTLAAATFGATWAAAAEPLRGRPLRALELPLTSPMLAARPLANEAASLPLPSPLPAPGGSVLELQSHFLAFGPVAADEVKEQSEAILVRVVSDGPWFLWLTCGGILVEEHGRRLPASRLAWRGGDGSEFQRLHTGAPALVARGPATGPAGERVSIDLRLEVHDEDPMGGLRTELRLQLAN